MSQLGWADSRNKLQMQKKCLGARERGSKEAHLKGKGVGGFRERQPKAGALKQQKFILNILPIRSPKSRC